MVANSSECSDFKALTYKKSIMSADCDIIADNTLSSSYAGMGANLHIVPKL
ncbi:hypothetical protein GCM10023172_32540 [Hymenobacter ginsengisoli]|uniref:Uncharacterized protein n=1 Tax=Hymenobacter ginsengisoli TaxID=1051626 RepID=A0ABP8QNV4_9BACT